MKTNTHKKCLICNSPQLQLMQGYEETYLCKCRSCGFVVSGYSQILSYVAMAVFLFFMGRKVANQKLKLNNSLIITSIVLLYIASLYFINPLVENGKYILFITLSMLVFIVISVIYIKQQKINPIVILKSFLGKHVNRKTEE